MISGYATSDGTADFAADSGILASNFKKVLSLTLSNVGIGTYLGNPDGPTDEMVKNAVKQSVLSGINVIDTAINYRSQKAERSVGKAISELLAEGEISRQQIFVCTKNGYVTNDADVQQDFWEYIKERFTSKGTIQQGDITSQYHCMTVPYLSDQLEQSLKNMDMDCVDLMYLHNAVEGQYKDVSREQFLENLYKVFEMYEKKRSEGKIRFYGMATWECFRVPKDDQQYLSLEETVKMAEQIAGDWHGFRFIQIPFNMYYDQALLKRYQSLGGRDVSILECAQNLGVGVFTSVPFMQGRLLQPGVLPEFGGLGPALRSLQFIRSTPGVIAPLVGQKSAEHIAENIRIMKVPPLTEDEHLALIEKLVS